IGNNGRSCFERRTAKAYSADCERAPQQTKETCFCRRGGSARSLRRTGIYKQQLSTALQFEGHGRAPTFRFNQPTFWTKGGQEWKAKASEAARRTVLDDKKIFH